MVAFDKVYGRATPTAHDVALAWFNPFTVTTPATFAQAMLVAVFIYWGWDTGATVNEETENPQARRRAPPCLRPSCLSASM